MNTIKYTKKQLRIIEHLKSLGDNDRLAAYEKRVADRAKAKADARKKRSEESVEAASFVKIGDVFSMSWGYDQTNVDFFQVVGKTNNSVRLRQVMPKMLHNEASGPMAANRTYEINNNPLPAYKNIVFIKNQDTGDLKRIFGFNGKVFVKMRSYAYAYRVDPGTETYYESWYA